MNDAAVTEVFINALLSACEARDPEGLYIRARSGQIKNFTGISAPYEPPEVVLDTAAEGATPTSNAEQLVAFLSSLQR